MLNNELTDNIPSSIASLSNLQSLNLVSNQLTGSIPSSIGSLSKLEYLYLNSNNLTGSIPSSIGSLSKLELLLVHSNKITGSIPSSIGYLSKLEYLNLGINQLTGSIPSSIASLLNLVGLFLYFNQLVGSIPPFIGFLSNLNSLQLNNNQLTGSIPSSIGSLSNLEFLYLYSNKLTGSIPSSIGYLSMLEYLNLYSNQLTGSIPFSIGSLSRLQILYIYFNQLTGSIPSSIGHLSELEHLNLYSNQLIGSIPSSIESLTNLVDLDLGSNQLTGGIPSSIGSLFNLQSLDLISNQLTGSIPSSIGFLTNLVDLDLSDNQLRCSIPTSIGSLLKLEYLYLYSSQLTGIIPSSVGFLSNLYSLSLHSNQLTGSIPSSIGSLLKLQELNLQINQLIGSIPFSIGSLLKIVELNLFTNQLTGSIPSSIGTLTNLNHLQLNCNQLVGSVPSSVEFLSNLYTLDLDTNQLTGSIPSFIGSLSKLELLYLYSNKLTGSIPSSIASLLNLVDLYFYSNKLTGSIPSSVGSLLNLCVLDLSNNQLTGSIPSSIGFLTNLVDLYLYVNQLTGSIPSSIGSLLNLQSLDFSSNKLIGSIPSGCLSSLQLLNYFDVSSNQLSGRFFDQIESSSRKSPRLQEISIADNLFSGSFSSLDFSSLPLLVSLDAASNCLTGSISDTICAIGGSLQSLALGGAGANPTCIKNDDANRRRPLFVHGYFSPLGLEGSIPSCIFGFEVLSTLQLSGNKLQGTIPELSSINESSTSPLSILLLSNNALTGTIPVSIQRHAFLQLDLSSNRLHGTLVDDFVVSSEQVILGLSVNRLSGPLPHSLRKSDISPLSNMSSLSILATNLFGCDSSELPPSDPSAESYSCGSYEMDVACYVYVTLAGATMLVIAVLLKVVLRMQSGSGCFMSMMQKVQMTQSWYKSFRELTAQYAFVSTSAPSTISFPDTIAFLVLVNLISMWAKRYLILSVVLLIPVFVALSLSGSSILTVTYGYIISSTFLHGIGPVVILILLLVLLFGMLVAAYRGLESLFGLYRSRVHRSQAWALGKRAYAVAISLHVVNLVVTLSVNALYVSTLLSQNTLSQSQRLIVEISVGTFKLVWNSLYIPSAMKWLDKYMSHSSSMQNYMAMSLVNFIVAPCIATISSNQSCFYYAFASQSAIQAPPVEKCIISQIIEDEIVCIDYGTISFELSSRPPFQYSYACGSALLVAYIPVLVYSYTIAGVVLPLVRLLMVHYQSVIDRAFFNKLVFWKPDRVQGRQLVTSYLIQIIVLLTFGLASPILSIVIVTCVVSNVLLDQVLVGRIYQMDKQIMAAAQNIESDVEVNPVHDNNDNVQEVVSDPSDTSRPRPRLSVNMLTLEHLDMKDAWNSVFVNGLAMMTTVSGFWAYLFFDMIADDYGLTNGLITSSLFGFLFPVVVWTVYRVIPSSWESANALEKLMIGWDAMSVSVEPAAAEAAAGVAGEARTSANQCIEVVVEGDVGVQMEDIVHSASD
jgi:Leucine-rich repeat (LRR) protein